VKLVIYDCKHPEEMKELSTGLSNALGFVAFGEEVYWNVNDPKPKWTYSDEIRPPRKEGEPYEGYSILGVKYFREIEPRGLFDLGYLKLVEEKKFKEADGWIEELDKKFVSFLRLNCW
jgi:hypothetical protein